MSIHWPILKSLLRRPKAPVIIDDKRTYKAAEVLIPALHVADRLAAVSSAKHVGILIPTSGGFPIAALACWILGRTAVPLNYLLKPEELQYVVDDAGLDTIITVQPMLDHLGDPPTGPNLLRLEDINFRSVPEPRIPAFAGDDQLAVLLYTSGTSGKPKGVMLTHGNISANIRQIDDWVTLDRSDVVLGVLPQFHSFGLTVLTLLPLTLGFKAVYTARFSPPRLLQLMREHKPTLFVAIPSMLSALLHAKSAAPEDFASIRYLVSGGEPLPHATYDGFRERFGVTICEGYGLTETAPVTNWCRPEEQREHTVGRALPRITQRVVDLDTGKPLAPGHEGEVQIAGPNVMRGYYRLPEETARVFTDDGFFRTGDIGTLDARGFLSITGRLKEMLIVGGENVFPREIEEVLNKHPAVNASGVVGMQDPVRGELPVAFVELVEGQPFDEKALIAHCRASLAGYKVPRHIHHLDELPRNPTGKILRRDLRARLGESTTNVSA